MDADSQPKPHETSDRLGASEDVEAKSSSSSFSTIAILILAGEAVFLLPFVLPRIFRPTFLAVFEMNNVEIGQCFSTYGVIALVSYLLGGPIADRFPPRKLMSTALWFTALGGFVASSYPSLGVMRAVYGYWGFTTIFLFWAAMLKATRQWGGDTKQGRAFGFLDGGRGLVSALLGSAAVYIFAMLMGDKVAEATLEQQQSSFRSVILFTSCLVAVVGAVVWFCLQDSAENEPASDRKALSLERIGSALGLRSVWLLMSIVLCGYVGYKATDDLSLYASDVMKFDDVRAAQIGTLLLFVRPVIGILAGFLADFSRSATWIIAGFAMMLVGAIAIASGVIAEGTYFAFWISLLVTCIGVYAIRSLYFAAMQEGQIPLGITGTAIGLISVIGYTPDIFMGPIMGKFLDDSPGELGHQHLFTFLACFSVAGLIATVVFRFTCCRSND